MRKYPNHNITRAIELATNAEEAASGAVIEYEVASSSTGGPKTVIIRQVTKGGSNSTTIGGATTDETYPEALAAATHLAYLDPDFIISIMTELLDYRSKDTTRG